MRPSTTTVDPTLTAGPSRAGLEEARPKMKSKRWVRDADEKVMTEIADTVNDYFKKCRKDKKNYEIPDSIAYLTQVQYVSHMTTASESLQTMGPESSNADISELITCLQTGVLRAHNNDYDTCDTGTGTGGAWSFR